MHQNLAWALAGDAAVALKSPSTWARPSPISAMLRSGDRDVRRRAPSDE